MNPKSMMLAIMPLIYLSSLASAAEIKTSERRVLGQYIVVLKSNSSGAGDFRAMAVGSALGLVEKHHAHLSHIYQNSIKGFAVEADEATAQKLANEPNAQQESPFQLKPSPADYLKNFHVLNLSQLKSYR